MGYSQAKVILTYADSTDLHPNQLPDIDAYGTLASDHKLVWTGLSVVAAEGSYTVTIPGGFVTQTIVIKNAGTTYSVYAAFTGAQVTAGAEADAASSAIKIPPGAVAVLPHIKTATNITLTCITGASTTVDVIAVGS